MARAKRRKPVRRTRKTRRTYQEEAIPTWLVVVVILIAAFVLSIAFFTADDVLDGNFSASGNFIGRVAAGTSTDVVSEPPLLAKDGDGALPYEAQLSVKSSCRYMELGEIKIKTDSCFDGFLLEYTTLAEECIQNLNRCDGTCFDGECI